MLLGTLRRIKEHSIIEDAQLLLWSVKFVAVAVALPILLATLAMSPLSLGYAYLPLNFENGDLTWNVTVLVLFYAGWTSVLPVALLIIGDRLGARRQLSRIDEAQREIPQTDEYLQDVQRSTI